ncbi:MAG TPA: CotH kinase family protein, partial [Bacteroidota bacterium]|nr:CotH kinase family protein [Bacteroidota bacterium]
LVTGTPEFSLKGGLFALPVSVSLSTTASNAQINYTLDGAEPTTSSPVYSTPIRIDTTTVVRARVSKDGMMSGTIATQTYIIGKQTSLLVMSLTTDPSNLWDSTKGIYVNFEQDIEAPVHLEIFDPHGGKSLGVDAGLQIFGGWSAHFPQKSFAVLARDKYGASSIDYRLFPNLPYDKYKSFVLRNSGTDFWNTHFRDGMMQSLISGLDIETQAYRPAVVYLNGAYWGILNVREKINEHYLESHFGVKENEIDMIESRDIVLHGDTLHYSALLDYIGTHDMRLDASYDYVKTQMDVSNFLNYETSEIYFANTDWPGWNVRYWRPRTPEGKWRWIVYDLDGGFGLGNPWEHGYSTMLDMVTDSIGHEWPNPSWSTFLLRKMLENKHFQQDFVNRCADHMNTIFRPSVVSARIDAMAAELEPEIQSHLARFGRSYDVWKWDVNDLKIFGDHRVDSLRLEIISKFSLAGLSTVTLHNAAPVYGAIQVNNLVHVSDSTWSGSYFKGNPIELTATAFPGCRFVRWTGDISGNTPSVTVPLNGDVSVTAVFEAVVAGAAEKPDDKLPKTFALGQNYPNPFNPETRIIYELPKAGMVTLTVYDLLGKTKAVLVNEYQSAGRYSCRFSAVGLGLPSGVYFYHLRAGNFSAIKRMMVVK